tara:strand:- start:18 stop:1214 length:1197 start_codon:yes stop_codon:yes gene_type:complete
MRKIFKLFILSLFLISCEGEENTTPEPTSKFTLTTQVNPEEGGTVFPSSGEYNDGDQVSVQATPSQYYFFDKWGGNGNGSNSNPLNVTINSNITLIAEFELIDDDGDGVTDELDNCPDTPSGSTVDQNGCALSQLDSDNDGIDNEIDICPDTPEDTEVNEEGCPYIFLAENGVTLKANSFAEVGSYYLYESVSYLIIDDNNIPAFLESDDLDASILITTFLTKRLPWPQNFAGELNEDISAWDVSNITDMSYAFTNDKKFNQDISNWDVSNVTNMRAMFYATDKFDQDISSWDVSNVNQMGSMFREAIFNQDIESWNVSKVEDMDYMFGGSSRFNKDISGWDVSNVTKMPYMFYNNKYFNQDLSGWNVDKVTLCTDFRRDADAYSLPIPNFTLCNSGG